MRGVIGKLVDWSKNVIGDLSKRICRLKRVLEEKETR